jgi:hypothetical protein
MLTKVRQLDPWNRIENPQNTAIMYLQQSDIWQKRHKFKSFKQVVLGKLDIQMTSVQKEELC